MEMFMRNFFHFNYSCDFRFPYWAFLFNC